MPYQERQYGVWAGHLSIRRLRQNGVDMRNDPSHPSHGTSSGYDNWGCRCDRCKKAKRAAMVEYRRKVAVGGGT
jgi:hypothetical protein